MYSDGFCYCCVTGELRKNQALGWDVCEIGDSSIGGGSEEGPEVGILDMSWLDDLEVDGGGLDELEVDGELNGVGIETPEDGGHSSKKKKCKNFNKKSACVGNTECQWKEKKKKKKNMSSSFGCQNK